MQARGEGLIQVGVDIGEDMSLRRSLMRGYTTEVLNRRLETSVIEDNNIRRKGDGGRWGDKGLSTVATYTQVENALGLHLI